MWSWVAAITLGAVVTAQPRKPPHIVYFLVDDLGNANVGFHNDEPITPHIDSLAAEGIELVSLYAYKFCSPTRSSIMSGRLPIHVNQQNHPPPYPGGGVPLEMTAMADHLQSRLYQTHQIGKWHCGMSGVDRLPIHRGFNSSLGYLSGAEDHYDQTRDGEVDFWRSDGPAYGLNGSAYSSFLYQDELIRIINNHNTLNPLFIYMAFQNVHEPCQVPANFTDAYASKRIDYNLRLLCLGMISAVDNVIGVAVGQLKERGLYDDTLIIFSSDNGGPHDHANNYPYRGSKGADFEGGTRVVAFVSGGIIPTSQRGTKRHGLMHVCDWYATLGHLAGYTPTDPKAEAANLPPPDSIDMWPWIIGNLSQSPRTEVCLSGGTNEGGSGLIKIIGNTTYKLVRGVQGTSMFPGPHMPNSTDDGSNSSIDCGDGQLFNLDTDPIEHVDLSSEPQFAAILASMRARATALDATYFQSDGRDAVDPAARTVAESKYRGFWGPWLPPGPVPPPPSPPPPAPNPPSSGHFFKVGDKCLGADRLVRMGVVVLGQCDSTSKWATAAANGAIYNAGMTDDYAYLRHHPPSTNCDAGTPMMLGEETGDVFTTFSSSSGQILSHSCAGMCVGVAADGSVGLQKCSGATKWVHV